jgi:hypothetical protein
MNPNRHDINSQISPAAGLKTTVVTAGGSSDGAYLDTVSIVIDRHAHGNAQSCSMLSTGLFALATGKTATVQSKIQHSDAEAGPFTDYKEGAATVYAAADFNGKQAVQAVAVDLAGAKRYVKQLIKATMSATATDTAAMTGVLIFETGDRH